MTRNQRWKLRIAVVILALALTLVLLINTMAGAANSVQYSLSESHEHRYNIAAITVAKANTHTDLFDFADDTKDASVTVWIAHDQVKTFIFGPHVADDSDGLTQTKGTDTTDPISWAGETYGTTDQSMVKRFYVSRLKRPYLVISSRFYKAKNMTLMQSLAMDGSDKKKESFYTAYLPKPTTFIEKEK